MAEPKAVAPPVEAIDNNEAGYNPDRVNLNSNISGRIENPLAGIPRDTLLLEVEKFAEEKALTEHVNILKKKRVHSSPKILSIMRILRASTA
ncbi:hypothetical protein VE04_09962 [Pseudogymnoascus sp. 24MN13]|nr:hypothetical protein VE04_09962 [Pseudogymnoascus sp. 24MN13]